MRTLRWDILIILAIILVVFFGIERFYFRVTDGFRETNIITSFVHHPAWEVIPPTQEQEIAMEEALSQPYSYLGKGCQSYVFGSRDGKYVIKFFKNQRYRLSPLMTWLPERYLTAKRVYKWEKRERFAQGWKLAYEHLPTQTGVFFVQLNPPKEEQFLTLTDKLGWSHQIPLHRTQFLLQRRVTPLEEVIGQEESENVVLALLDMILDEYALGFYDNDPALAQNFGVDQGAPVHLDVGQLRRREDKNQEILYTQDFYDKVVRLANWLELRDPLLAEAVQQKGREVLGPEYDTLIPSDARCY